MTPEEIAKMPGLVLRKNNQSAYTGISERLAKMLGWRSFEHALGRTDYEVPSDVSKVAATFRMLDLETLAKRKSLVTLDVLKYSDGWHVILLERTPCIEFPNKEEIHFQMIDVTLFPLYTGLIQIALGNSGKSDKSSQFCYRLENFPSHLKLTKRQEEVLFFVLRGQSARRIGAALHISVRTVESHLISLYERFDCATKGELIEKAIDLGYLYYLPDPQTTLPKMTSLIA